MCPPPSASRADFSIMDGMYARNRQSPLCVHFVISTIKAIQTPQETDMNAGIAELLVNDCLCLSRVHVTELTERGGEREEGEWHLQLLTVLASGHLIRGDGWSL